VPDTAQPSDPPSGADPQSLADGEQTRVDADQTAADRDQATSDRDLERGGDPHSHDATRGMRRRNARRREQSALARLDAAEQRDALALERDLAATLRDHAADVRDLAIAQREVVSEHELGEHLVTGAEVIARARQQRRRAGQHRAEAAGQRAAAARDRQVAAGDREEAARERQHALDDRVELARQLAITASDPLTGARARAAGLTELEHEIDRCRRHGVALTLTYVDLVGLKAVNDTQGHGAGDELLVRVVALMRAHLRSYDLIIRLGGDEFACAMSHMTLADAKRRFGKLAVGLASAPGVGEIRSGFAELLGNETAAQLIARADNQLTAGRNGRGRRVRPSA
jgi:diguanylate cyclase (GGDEF)-like protein